MINIDDLKFDERGLIPAIVQDKATGEVLTLAYMNRESLGITIQEGFTCFYSRSRGQLWRKGESSGNVQKVVSITTDCDSDALLVKVIPAGPACHTGANTCFYQPLHGEAQERFSVDGLHSLLVGRKQNPQEGSYTTYLFTKGVDKILKKVGEETAEVIIAAKNNDNHELTCELADLTYHALVLMAEQGLSPEDIRGELARRYAQKKGGDES
ncbi:MAG: bifunctional phosphoribosyl-AMP cyclohydrolase/phosphoribosyl-ATP diphosphatase HisIE [Oscillospiraceae bacterium]|nr:bifunctional phosphoribosyl-AMP cyclohydrolase/phosphoribosyl-ATP diphosphatase HisIE [Oscillospiraceae bacterium]